MRHAHLAHEVTGGNAPVLRETKRDGQLFVSPLNFETSSGGLADCGTGRVFSVFALFRSVRFDLELGCVEDIVFALNASSFFGGRFLLNHLATAFEHTALFNYQRRSLNVAVQFSGAAEFDTLARDDVTVDGAEYLGDGDLDVC